jgi:Spy/CpxP family protein refolding chaperone
LSLNGPRAILEPDVATELKLTDDQKQKLDTLGKEFFQSLPPSPRGSGKDLTYSKVGKNREEYTTKAIDVLTAEQKETLNKMKGNEIDVSQLTSARPPAKGN